MMTDAAKRSKIPGSKNIDKLNEYTYKVAIFRAGLELNIWEKIAKGENSAGKISEKEGWDLFGTRMLLDDLCALKLLRKHKDIYSLTKEADYYLIPGKPAYEGKYLINDFNWEGNGRLANAIRTGKRPIDHNAIGSEMVDDWLGVYVPNLMDLDAYVKISSELWKTLDIEAHEGMQVLDIACGPAPRTLMLAGQDPGVRITLLDWNAILKAALEFARSLHVEKLITTMEGDLWSTDFGSNKYDLVYLGNITHFFSPEENTRLFQKVYDALVPGGLIAVRAIRREFPAPTGPGLWFYAVSRGGGVYDFTEYKRMLENAGFNDVRGLERLPIRAVKPE
jgi:SAM-dependent methyltransferase